MIGERLLELRKDAGLTQDDLAVILNINKHSVSSYERDKSEPLDAIKIVNAKYFNVSVDYLLGMTDNSASHGMERNLLRLPAAFPENRMDDLQAYIDYLIFKNRKAQ